MRGTWCPLVLRQTWCFLVMRQIWCPLVLRQIRCPLVLRHGALLCWDQKWCPLVLRSEVVPSCVVINSRQISIILLWLQFIIDRLINICSLAYSRTTGMSLIYTQIHGILFHFSVGEIHQEAPLDFYPGTSTMRITLSEKSTRRHLHSSVQNPPGGTLTQLSEIITRGQLHSGESTRWYTHSAVWRIHKQFLNKVQEAFICLILGKLMYHRSLSTNKQNYFRGGPLFVQGEGGNTFSHWLKTVLFISTHSDTFSFVFSEW